MEDPKITISKISQWWTNIQNSEQTHYQQEISNDAANSTSIHRWSAPVQGSWKINCNAAFCQKTHKSQIGLICRDFKGDVIRILSKKFHSHSPLQSEAMAIREALRFLETHRSHPIIIESDCLNAVRLANSPPSRPHGKSPSILEEIRHLTQGNPSFKISYIPRQANRVAHWLAKNDASLGMSNNVFNAHPQLLDLIKADSACITFI